MAEKIVQPKVKNADSSYDELIVKNAVNSVNTTKINNIEIKKDENDILKADTEIISRKKLIFSSDEGVTSYSLTGESYNKRFEIHCGSLIATVKTNDRGIGSYNYIYNIDHDFANLTGSTTNIIAQSVYYSIGTLTGGQTYFSVKNTLFNFTTKLSTISEANINKIYEIIE